MFLSFGFRPFFLLGAIWAALAMVLWIAMLSGMLFLPIVIDPVSWHAHEFLFGYLGSIIAGFLLTAIASWTGRPPVAGSMLASLVFVWLLGRAVFAMSVFLSPLVVAVIDLSFPVFLAIVVAREIVAAKNWRNLIVVIALTAFAIANGIFYLETGWGEFAAQGVGLRFGLAAVLMQISIIGGRVIPAFTRNWLIKEGRKNLPAEPMMTFDIVTLVVTMVCLLGWVIWPDHLVSGFAILLAGMFQTVRLARWAGVSTLANPLLFILHVGYAFIPIGALFVGFSIVLPGFLSLAASQHIWMSGAVGVMTLALMTRATLGHSDKELHADKPTIMIYLAIIGATLSRVVAEILTLDPMVMYSVSASLWVLAFLGFAVFYGPLLIGLTTTDISQEQS